MDIIDNVQEECSICLEDVKNGNISTLHCGHVLHTECLMLHVNYKLSNSNISNVSCPVCRHPLLSDLVIDVDDNEENDTDASLNIQQEDYSRRFYNMECNKLLTICSIHLCISLGIICVVSFRFLYSNDSE